MHELQMTWKEGEIDGCVLTPLKKFADERGWLAEVFREDELDESFHPVMAYLSATEPGVKRGPHEHVEQADLFVFFDGRFRVFLWDAREDAATYGTRRVLELGRSDPATLLVPPGVVHAYENISPSTSLVFNLPNRLYAGWKKREPVDEIRHEEHEETVFEMRP